MWLGRGGGGGQELKGVKEQSPKAEAKSAGHLTFFTAVESPSSHSSDQRPADFFCKGSDVKYFWLCEPDGLRAATAQLCHRCRKAAMGHR